MRNRLLILLLCALPAVLRAASPLPVVDAREAVPGCVTLVDGEQMRFPYIYLPDYTEPGLLCSRSASGRDSLILFDADEVLYIDFYHPATPTVIHRLYSVRLRRQPHRVAHYWAVLDIQTPYGFTVMAYPRYRMKADGGLERITLYGNRPFSRPLIFALHYGEDYYVNWPPDLDSQMWDYLSREGSDGNGMSPIDFQMLFDSGFSPDDFEFPDPTEFGM